MRSTTAFALLAICSIGALAQDAASIADGTVRFIASDAKRTEIVPSMALQRPFPSLGRAPADFPVVPEFFETDDDKEAFRIAIDPGTSLYGTGEVAGPLLRNGRVIETWNLDAYGYGEDATNLYKSHPWVLAVREDGTAFGVLADTTYRVRIDLTTDIEMVSDGPDFPVIVIDGDSPQQVLRRLATLVGTIEMPPEWALGYHQCRYSYYPDSRVREIADGFREHEIPCDVIWMDIDYMDEFRVFTFDPEGFPHPARTNDYLHANGFHSIWMIDPGVRLDPGYSIYDAGEAIDAWVRNAAGETYVGEVWPGECVFPDYTNAAVREWWAKLYAPFMALGVDGVWNDMNEPAVFNVESKTMPEDNLHRADEALGGPGPHARFHNVYGMLMVQATREGIMAANPDKRPFVLSRAGYIGSHRYAATWSGDNTADWAHLEMSTPMVLNMGLSGHPFTGPDIGGFVGNGTPEMFARWMGIGALYPFCRGHTGKGNIDKEPWAFGEDVGATCRAALERRYRLLPYIYTLFREASQTGMPVVRPLFFHDPADPALRSEDGVYLLGADLMVVTQPTPLRDREHAMPKDFATGGWRAFNLGDNEDPDLPRLFQRAGSIIAVGPVVQHTGEDTRKPMELRVALDADGVAGGVLYEDAGDGWGYREGEYRSSLFAAWREGDEVRVRVVSTLGDYDPGPRRYTIRVLHSDGRETTAQGDPFIGMSRGITVPTGATR